MLHLGLDIGGTKMEAVLLDAEGNSQFRERRQTQKKSYQDFIVSVLNFIHDIKIHCNVTFSIGIGLPGTVDPVSGLIKNSNCLALNGNNLKNDLARHLQQPVFIANDADCFTLSEAIDGAAAGYESVFGVIIGTGCGGGLVIKRSLIRGPNAITGEWGHNPLPGYVPTRDGAEQSCYCGQKNCIESYISGTGFTRRFNASQQTSFTTEEILAKAINGDPCAQAHYQHFIDAFARSLASVANILDPHVFVLGGGLSNVDTIYQDLPVALGKYVFSHDLRTTILKAKFGDASGVRGAAWLPTFQPDIPPSHSFSSGYCNP